MQAVVYWFAEEDVEKGSKEEAQCEVMSWALGVQYGSKGRNQELKEVVKV